MADFRFETGRLILLVRRAVPLPQQSYLFRTAAISHWAISGSQGAFYLKHKNWYIQYTGYKKVWGINYSVSSSLCRCAD